jgi:hypothetical protein
MIAHSDRDVETQHQVAASLTEGITAVAQLHRSQERAAVDKRRRDSGGRYQGTHARAANSRSAQNSGKVQR